MRTYYTILGISSSSSPVEIKTAYKKLAVKYHPDKNAGDKGAEEKFKEINTAYQVLSDSNQKARYDLVLAYQNFVNEQSTTFTQGSPYNTSYQTTEETTQRQHRTYRVRPRPKSTRRYSKKQEERIAMIWVAVFLVSIFAIVGIGGAYSSYQTEVKAQEKYAQKMEVFGSVLAYYESSDYRRALESLEQIIVQEPTNRDQASVFKQEIVSKVSVLSEESFKRKEFERSLNLLKILGDYDTRTNVMYFDRLATCYQNVGQYENAILALRKIFKEDKRNIKAYTRIGLIYCNNLNDLSTGIALLDSACTIVVEDYRQTYGNAFSMLVHPSSTPESHFNVFLARGETYLKLGKYQKAIEDFNWAAFLRPKKAISYELKGDCFQRLGKNGLACESWQQAVTLKSSSAKTKSHTFCQ